MLREGRTHHIMLSYGRLCLHFTGNNAALVLEIDWRRIIGEWCHMAFLCNNESPLSQPRQPDVGSLHIYRIKSSSEKKIMAFVSRLMCIIQHFVMNKCLFKGSYTFWTQSSGGLVLLCRAGHAIASFVNLSIISILIDVTIMMYLI